MSANDGELTRVKTAMQTGHFETCKRALCHRSNRYPRHAQGTTRTITGDSFGSGTRRTSRYCRHQTEVANEGVVARNG